MGQGEFGLTSARTRFVLIGEVGQRKKKEGAGTHQPIVTGSGGVVRYRVPPSQVPTPMNASITFPDIGKMGKKG